MFPESRTDASADAAQLTPVLVGRRASLTPEAIAVEHGRQRMTYAELDARSNRLAHLLRAQGAGPDLPVGVRLARGLDLVVGLLAIWRAGAAYLPLDPEAPESRTAALIAASATSLVLTDAEGAAAVTGAGARPVVPENLAAELTGQPATAPATGVDGANAAYVMHTSGSTGTPKGVVVSHAGIANRIGWTVRQHGLTAEDRVLQKTALVFDAHVWEVFAPLVAGGTVVLAPAGAERDPAALVRAVGEHAITVLQVVPSVLRLLVAEDGWQDCGALRLVFCAGEPLHAELAQRLLALTGAELWNTYGPTECSIDVTAHRFDPAQLTGPVPIGRPIDKTRVLVVDASGTPVGVGVPGELLAGGVGVARGYLGRPGQTAASFVPDPYAKDGSRLYRTGDRVSWRADGVLEYLGRIDDQVKVNGVRIEPAEVEAQLAAHPAVAGAVVRPYDVDGAKRLAAYYVSREPVTETELRGHLLDRLPSTHVPAALIALESFPLGPTGKVDRRALPSPDAPGASQGRAPAGDAELLVAEVWQDILGFRPLTARADFFRIGGTSLQLTRIAARLRAATGHDIPLRALLGAPTLADHAALIDAAAGQDTAPIRPVPRDGGLPLSYGQRRLWFMDRMHSASPEWVAGLLLKIPAGTAPELVGRALDTLVARHEALRTRYAEADGEPRQFIEAPAAVPLRAISTDRDGLAAALAELLGTGFRLDSGPLLRAALVTLDDATALLAVAMHHITTDGWSTAVLEREFHQVLAALRGGDTPVLPDLPVQYADFALWQREQLTDEVVERELAHWRAVLDGHQPLALPADHPRPAVRDGRGGITPVTVDAPTLKAVDAIARAHGTTRFAVLLTAYATVLARHSGQWDLPVGAPVAGRDRPELDGVVGFFLNNVVLRCTLDAGLGFNDAVARVAAATRDALAHQDLPFDLLVDALVPDRDLSRTPLYQAAFDLHGEDFNGTVEGDTETVRKLWRITHTDLTLLLRPCEADGTLVGGLEYATSLYEEATAARLACGLTTLLAAAAAAPDTALGALELLTPAEHAELTRWGAGEASQPVMSTPQLFAAQAVRTPHAVAVEGDGFRLTYRELAARAARIARYLRSVGVHRGDTVGVLLDRGPQLHAVLLAVWQTGAAYVPVDPAFPADRVTGMLADSGARVLVTEAAHPVEDFRGTVVRIDGAEAGAIAAQETWTPPLDAHLDDLAYIVYTSGSTGRPKGVAVTHRGLANHLEWAVAELAAAGTGGGAVFSSVAFDLVVPNLWAPLLTGQRVLLLPQDLDLSELGERLSAHAPFSFLKLTPGHLDVLAQQLSRETAAALAPVVVVAGEALDGSLAASWAGLLGDGGRLINEYGPTEASVGTSIHPVPAAVGPGTVPIGSPLPGMVMRILDERMRLVPAGAVGELYVGGTGVARGYVGRPGLTAEKFLPDPYGPAGARLYRTGDVARWLDGGAVEFLGRTDDQVKIRGYRVETGEIRAVLLDHPGVADAVVVATGTGAQVRLTAYFTPAPGTAGADAASLAAHSALSLPPYMVPAGFTELDRIPLNPNGKVDRRALPDPAAAAPARRTRPANELEERILEIWRDACGIEAGLDDNFFHAGGNSILAIRLIAAIQTDFEITLPVRAVFDGPTVAELAQTVEDRIRAEITEMSDSEVMAASMLLKEQNA